MGRIITSVTVSICCRYHDIFRGVFKVSGRVSVEIKNNTRPISNITLNNVKVHGLDICRTSCRLLTTYLPIDDELSLQEVENVERIRVEVSWMAGKSLSPVMITSSSEEEFDNYWQSFHLLLSSKKYHHLWCHMRTQVYHHLIICHCPMYPALFLGLCLTVSTFYQNVLK